MNNDTNKYADLMLDRISQCIKDGTKDLPALSGAIVSSVNTDGTINVYFPPDNNKVFTNLSNQTPFVLQPGDSVELLLKDGNYNNCWIVAKHQTTFKGNDIKGGVLSNYATLDDLKKVQASLITETDPYFSASPAASITQQDITNWNNASSASPSSTTPKMDGTASIGSENNYARGDHIHPTDTTRQLKITASGILKGDGNGTITAAVSDTDYQSPLPSQSGNSGKFLTTNGSILSWGDAGDSLPSQTGQSGKYLTTDGTDASWSSISIPVTSVNSKTGAVVLTASDVGALADSVIIPVNFDDLQDVFIAEFDVTTYAQVTAAYTAGKIIYVTDSSCKIYVPLIKCSLNDAQHSGSGNFYFGTIGTHEEQNGDFYNVRITLDEDDNWTKEEIDMADWDSVQTQLSYKANLSGPAFTGNPTAPTQDNSNNSTRIATTAFVKNVMPTTTSALTNDSGFITAASPALTGTPTAPTAAAGTDSIQIATTAFVQAAVQAAGGVTPASALPLVDGTAAVGTSLKYAREDHVHPLPSIPSITLVDWTVS